MGNNHEPQSTMLELRTTMNSFQCVTGTELLPDQWLCVRADSEEAVRSLLALLRWGWVVLSKGHRILVLGEL